MVSEQEVGGEKDPTVRALEVAAQALRDAVPQMKPVSRFLRSVANAYGQHLVEAPQAPSEESE